MVEIKTNYYKNVIIDKASRGITTFPLYSFNEFTGHGIRILHGNRDLSRTKERSWITHTQARPCNHIGRWLRCRLDNSIQDFSIKYFVFHICLHLIEIFLRKWDFVPFHPLQWWICFRLYTCSLLKLNLPPICRYVCQSMQCNGIVMYIEFNVEINCVQRVEARWICFGRIWKDEEGWCRWGWWCDVNCWRRGSYGWEDGRELWHWVELWSKFGFLWKENVFRGLLIC